MKDIRARFPGTQDQVYLNVSLRGLVPDSVMEAASRHLDGRLRKAVLAGADLDELEAMLAARGHMSMLHSGMKLVSDGITTRDELARVCPQETQ